MSKYKTSMWEILFIILGGILTVGLSVMAVIKGNKQEADVKKYQDESRRLQKETKDLQIRLSEKSDKIILLNEELRKLSNSQVKELKSMTKKIPSNVETLVNFKVPISESDKEILRTHFDHRKEGKSNIITRSLYKQSGLNMGTINSLFTSSIELHLTFTGKNSDKKWNIFFKQQPILFTEHPLADNGTFMLYFDDDFNLLLTGFFIRSAQCTSNSHSMYDFEEYELSFTISFSKPVNIHDKLMYMTLSDDKLVLEPSDLHLYLANQSGFQFKIEDFKEIRKNSFTSKGSLDLD